MVQMAMTQNFVWLTTDDTESDYIEFRQFKEENIIFAHEVERFNYTLFKWYNWLTLDCQTKEIYDIYRVFDKWELILESEDEVIELPYEFKDMVVRAYNRLENGDLIQMAISGKKIPVADNRQKKDSYKLSVVVPCYKAELFMSRTIDSILSSTLTDIELILVIDGSPQNDLEVARWYEKNYWCVKVISQENWGLSFARNRWLEAATGEYVAFCDADDIPHPFMYEKLYNTCKNENTDIAIGQVLIRTLPTRKEYHYKMKENLVYTFEEMVKNRHENNDLYFVAVWNKIVKTEIAQKVKFSEAYPKQPFVYEDVAYTGTLYSYLDRFAYCADAIHTWDQRKRQTVGSVSTWHKNEDNDYMWKTFIHGATYPMYNKSGKHLESHDYLHFDKLVEAYKKYDMNASLWSYWHEEMAKLVNSQKLWENKMIMANPDMAWIVNKYKKEQ